MIGASLWRRLQDDGACVWATTRRPDLTGADRPLVDLANLSWSALRTLSVASDLTVYICAAAARIAQCATDPKATRRVNVEGVVALARWVAARGAHIVFLSTNQVLPGDRPLAPADTPYGGATDYGRQKAEAEQALLSLNADVAVLRLSKVLSPEDPLISGWRQAFRSGRPVRPFYDMTAAPVSADLVSEVMIRIAMARGTGVFQLSADRDVSYADLAADLARVEGFDPNLIQPVSVASAGLPHRPPPYTSLDSHRIETDLDLAAPDAFAAIRPRAMFS